MTNEELQLHLQKSHNMEGLTFSDLAWEFRTPYAIHSTFHSTAGFCEHEHEEKDV